MQIIVLINYRDRSMNKGQSVILTVKRWKMDMVRALLERAATCTALSYK